MKTKRISEICEHCGLNRRDIENWLGRLEFRTEFAPVTQGVARQYTVENARELALISAFVRAGVEPRWAVAKADAVRRQILSTGGLREYVVSMNGAGKGIATSELDAEKLTEMLAEPGCLPVLSIVHVGAVVRRVDELYADADAAVVEERMKVDA
ncbi:hypothetical protein [Fulvimarina sp. MAC3]|uniref:hypothetical protein n=1 Tax=Fulvimarina sp. MAC3 TaxID=3148887 RepID=UPI0031FE3FCF